jgi:GntR family transcriptional regulator, transcriptional repressor for pyruvate dehydrogenase complex
MSPRVRTHDIVLHHVEDELRAGRLRIGDKLPPERALAEQLGLSRASAREAIRVLEAMGVVRTSPGSGPLAGALVVADTVIGISSAIRLHLASSHLPIDDVVQTRVLLESWGVAEAAARQDVDLLRSAEAVLETMERPGTTVAEFHLLDTEFHTRLARATGNEVVATMMSALRRAIHSYIADAATSLPDWTASARKLRREHRAIMAAVRDGDGERAAALVVRHIEGFYRDAKRRSGVTGRPPAH